MQDDAKVCSDERFNPEEVILTTKQQLRCKADVFTPDSSPWHDSKTTRERYGRVHTADFMINVHTSSVETWKTKTPRAPFIFTQTAEMENWHSRHAASSCSDVPLIDLLATHIFPACCGADPKKTPTAEHPSDLVFILP